MYFGSVRFFRHLILSVLALLIVVPVFFAIFFGIRYNHARHELVQLQNSAGLPAMNTQDNDDMQNQLQALQTQITDDVIVKLATLQNQLDELSGQTATINNKQASMQQQLTNVIKTQTASLRRQLEAEIDQKTSELMKKINDIGGTSSAAPAP
ncbi:hypothetical protein IZU99_02415 [Oscillospiraceae bacterium CM]|nr:hypothetical protein IZU99_02415 [Oscillospiraceae bacterium CM]